MRAILTLAAVCALIAATAISAPVSVRTSEASLITVNGGAGSAAPAPSPTYTPLFIWSAAGDSQTTVGQPIQDWSFNQTTTGYASGTNLLSDDIASPFGNSVTNKQVLVSGSNDFGGWLIQNSEATYDGTALDQVTMGEGTDVWWRMYHFFPNGTYPNRFSLSDQGGGDSDSQIKWFRLDFDLTGNRLYAHMFDATSNAENDNWHHSMFVIEAASSTSAVEAQTPLPIEMTRGQWYAVQIHYHFGSNDDGYAEMWIGDTYLGKAVQDANGPNPGSTSYSTMPSGASSFDEFVIGNYWNGEIWQDMEFYLDEIIITTNTPNTTDSGGRPYISPNTKVSDFP